MAIQKPQENAALSTNTHTEGLNEGCRYHQLVSPVSEKGTEQNCSDFAPPDILVTSVYLKELEVDQPLFRLRISVCL
jgi:hypothetical protein